MEAVDAAGMNCAVAVPASSGTVVVSGGNSVCARLLFSDLLSVLPQSHFLSHSTRRHDDDHEYDHDYNGIRPDNVPGGYYGGKGGSQRINLDTIWGNTVGNKATAKAGAE